MSRYETLLDIYHEWNTIYTGLILIAVWVPLAGHLLDRLAETKLKWFIPVYWLLVLIAYIGGIVFVGVRF